MIVAIKKAMAHIKFMVDSIKVVIAVYAFLCSATAYSAYISYEKDSVIVEKEEEIGHVIKQVAAVAQMIKPESYGYKSKGRTVVINNCGTICAKLILEHATGRKH